MKSFRNPKYLEGYEDVVFDLEQTLNINPGNTNEQKREGMRIVQIIREKLLLLIGIIQDYLLILKLINYQMVHYLISQITMEL